MVVAQQLVAFCIIHPNPVLQEMLHIVHLTASELLLQFNVDKSYGIAFGPNVGNLPSLCVGDKPLNWSSTVKYLGILMSSNGSFIQHAIIVF